MKKFNEWMESRNELVVENTPHASGVHYGRLLGQIMGWDSHGDPNTFGGRVQNWMAGGRHRKAQEMGADLYSTIENPANITAIITRAKKEGVFQTSIFNAAYGIVRKIASAYNPSETASSLPPRAARASPQFLSNLLHNILGKCHKTMGLDYISAEDFFHTVVGTEGAVKSELSAAYYKDPKDLKEWLRLASTTHKPHPTFNPTDRTAVYWRIEAANMISPLNLVRKLINDAPDGALSLPKNLGDLNNMSVEFAEAYFPHILNRRRAAAGTSNSGTGKGTQLGTDIDALIAALLHFDKNITGIDKEKGDSTANTGKKTDLVAALSGLIGPEAAAAAATNADPGSLMKILANSTDTFFGLQQLIEQKKLD